MAIGLLLALAVIYLAWPRVLHPDELWFEAGKAAMSAIAVGFFGVVIGFFVNSRDDQRKRHRELLEYRRGFLLEAGDAYGRIKAARRGLRADGLGPGGASTITATHLKDLDTHLEALSEAQLMFERLWREAGAQDAFTRRAELRTALEAVKDYVNRVSDEWEKGRPRIKAGHGNSQLAGWQRLMAFLESAKEPGSDFHLVSTGMKQIEEAIWTDVLPSKESGTQT